MEFGSARLDAIDGELQQFPTAVVQEFRQAHHNLEPLLQPMEMVDWAEQGAALARQTVRSWEAAAEYYRASTQVLPIITFPNLSRWTLSGHELCWASPTLASAYFRASPESLPHLAPSQIPGWGTLGRDLYKGTWRSSALACRFFEVSPQVLRSLTLEEMQRFAAFLDAVSQRSYDLAQECLVLGPEVFIILGDSKGSFLSLVTALAEGQWREVRGCFESAGHSLARIDRREHGRFLRIAERLARSSSIAVSGFLTDGSRALGEAGIGHHKTLLALGEALMAVHPPALPEFLRTAPAVIERAGAGQLQAWFAEGARLLEENRDSGMAFFSLESARAEAALEGLSSSVELSRVKDVVRLYCRALAGAHVEVASSEELSKKGIGWVSAERPSTEGSTVYLSPKADRYPTKGENFGWLKVIATHQVGHLEFGSFNFAFDQPSTLFPDLRPRLAGGQRAAPTAREAPPEPTARAQDDGSSLVTDMQRFFDLFPDRTLALDIFTVVEDGRLDAHVLNDYLGIRRDYRRIQHDALEGRPAMESLPAREALLELLVRLSLRQEHGLTIPSEHREDARAIAATALRVFNAAATVQDTAEATVRIYSILSGVPNQKVSDDGWEDLDPDSLGDSQDDQPLDALFSQADGAEGQPFPTGGGEQDSYSSPEEVDFRGDFKPETVQLLAMLRRQQGQVNAGAAMPISQEMLEELLKGNIELEALQGDARNKTTAFANNLMREAGIPSPPPDAVLSRSPFVHVDDDGESLSPGEPLAYLYDEWDFRAADYRPRWCIVRERVMAEGDISFWRQTLQAHAALIAQIRHQFELVAPQQFRKIRHLQDGEEFDLDSVIDAMVDRRLGLNPTDHIYARRNKTERDVAVLFLLDMSASTAEAIDEASRMADAWDIPDDPAEYLLWLRGRRATASPRRTYKRIIDLEKESVVLLTQALETLGDKYGFYGFSGYGRENVEFYAIKDLGEPLSERVRRRVDRITPLHATRMGPAIRHSITKLEGVEARTKVLFLISDGRPQDRGYSREGVEKEYAVHDTRMALLEAKRKGINPFCLTVDKAGHDYLKTMMGDMGYEVLSDISALPQRLPFLYQRLTL